MSVWASHPIDYRTRLSSTSMLVVGVLVLGLIFWKGPIDGSRTASQLDALGTPPPVNAVVGEAVFPSPVPIVWEGAIVRTFVSGQGLEIRSAEAPVGIFQAFIAGDVISPILQGVVRVEGDWVGYTCAYGGYQGSCVPQVTVRSIRQVPIQLQ